MANPDIVKERIKKVNDHSISNKVGGHSNYIAYDSYGEIVKFGFNQVCHSGVTYSEIKAEYLYIFFGKSDVKKTYKPELYMDWVINDSMYADAFITKDVEEGLREGFEMNTHASRLMMCSGILALRICVEDNNWSWSYFRERGFDPIESYALATNHHVINGTYIKNNNFNSNHLVIQRSQKYDLYGGAGFGDPTPDQCFAKGFNKLICVSANWGCVGYNLKAELPQGFTLEDVYRESTFGICTFKALPMSKEVLAECLNRLKEIK